MPAVGYAGLNTKECTLVNPRAITLKYDGE